MYCTCSPLISMQDYDHQLVCITEREKFVIPVRAIGARALLDFPDEVLFSAAPVKVRVNDTILHMQYNQSPVCMWLFLQYSSTKTVLVRNVGNKEAKFSLETKQ